MTCQCGASTYRSLDGERHCPRCESRTDACPACDGYGYVMQGRRMMNCNLCAGLGKRLVKA